MNIVKLTRLKHHLSCIIPNTLQLGPHPYLTKNLLGPKNNIMISQEELYTSYHPMHLDINMNMITMTIRVSLRLSETFSHFLDLKVL